MNALFRFMDWPLRAKMAGLLVIASLLPLAIAAVIDIHQTRERLLASAQALLAARGDQLVREMDTFNRGYLRAAGRLSHFPNTVEFCQTQGADNAKLKPNFRDFLNTWPTSDPNIRGVGILDLTGTVRIGTEDLLLGTNLSYHKYVQEALKGVPVISDIHLAESQVGYAPTIAYVAPVFGSNQKLIGIAVLWVRATALWNVAKSSNELAGPGSFAVLFDHHGIRIAHTYSDKIIFHPGGKLDPATVDALVAEQRFGVKTRQLLEDVWAFPEQFQRSLAESPDQGVFRGFAPVNQKWNYGVARRFETVPWTIFYMIPEESFNAQINEITRQKTIFAGTIILLALLAGMLVATIILKPIGSLSTATQLIAGGNLAARVPPNHNDELGQLSANFNSMAERIEAQAKSLQKARDELELRVQERTLELQTTNDSLKREIAARKQAEQANARLAAIVQSSDDAIISKTLDGVITSWNGGAKKLFGYGAEEAVGRPMLMLFPPDRIEEEPNILARIAHGESFDHFETVRIGKDGKRIDVSVTLSPIRDDQGNIVGASKIARDISERKHAEDKLQIQLSRLDLLSQTTRAIGERQDLKSIFQVVVRSLEDNLPIDFGCICLYDQPGHALTVANVGAKSQALALELAMPEQASIPIDQNGLSRCVGGQLVYEPNIEEINYPFPQRLTRGGLRSMVIAPLLVESQVFGVVVAGRREARSFSSTDCEFLRQLSEHVGLATHQSQLYGALQRAYDDLRQTQQAVMQQERLSALGQMASGIAHDINNAISPVALYTESLLEKEPNLSPRARDYLQTIRQAIRDVAETVAGMREFYRQREPQLTLVPVNLNQLAQQVVDLTRARWHDMPQQRSIVIEMRTNLAPDLPAVMGVESEIREALTNLIFNAVDAMPGGGTLTVRTKIGESAQISDAPAPQHVNIEVTDTGVGMSEETRRRCLEPFYTTKGERGTGLGLAMVYGMVQRHSADIEIDSEPGHGTTMRLIFPVSATVAGPVESTMIYAVPSRLRILVVDDDPLLIKSLRDALEGDGHSVVTANGGQEGIDSFRAALSDGNPFMIVVTDLGMPYVDGRKVASEVKAASPSTPVILLTGWGQRLITEGDVPSHVDHVLSKPPKLRELREALAHSCPAVETNKS